MTKKAQKVHTKNGFEYRCDRFWEAVTWYFRPTDCELWAHCSLTDTRQTRKVDVEKLVADPKQAREHYDRCIAQSADVAAAEKRLERCKKAHEHYQSEAFDPGGRRNNPGAVMRDLRRAASSGDEIKYAERELERAKEDRAILESGNRRKTSG